MLKKFLKNIICKLKNKRIIKIILFFKPSLIYLFRNKKINFTISNYYNNIKMNVSSDDLSIKTTYLSKNKDLIFVMEKYLKKNSTFVDVGSNVGAYSIIASKIIGGKGKVYCFEPSKVAFKKLYLNKKANKEFSNNMTLVRCALGNREQKNFLVCDNDVPGNYFLNDSLNNNLKQNSKKQKKEIVKIYTIDNYFKNYTKKIDLIKIDCEGYELKVLMGAKKIIKKFKPIFVIENSPNNLKIKKFLNKYNYKYFNLYNSGHIIEIKNNLFKTRNILAK